MMTKNLLRELHPQWRSAQCAFKRSLKPILEEFKLTKVDAKVLMVMQRNNAKSKAELAEYLHFEPASLTRSLDRLVENGVISRSIDQQDKRFIQLALTSHGIQLSKAYRCKIRKVWRQAFTGIDTKDIENFSYILQTISFNLNNEIG